MKMQMRNYAHPSLSVEHTLRGLGASCAFVVLGIASPAAAEAEDAPFHVVLDAPGHVCVEGEATVARGGEPGTAWTLLDWRGRETGISGSFDESGVAELPPLRTGYYRLGSTTLAVVPPRNPASRLLPFDSNEVPNAAPFYGTDSAMSWCARKQFLDCPWNGGDTFRMVADILWLSGIPHVRERLSWRTSNPEPGAFDWAQYLPNANLLRERGILVSDVFHDSPEWVDGRKRRLPSDLGAIFDFCFRAASDFGGAIGDWEFWNEPDVKAASPVWDYAAALKAAYFGFKAARPDMPVAPAGMGEGPGGFFMRTLFANDAAKFADVFNYHVYSPLSHYPELFGGLRSVMEKNGIGERAIWLTEIGGNVEGPAAGTDSKRKRAHTPEQELIVAEFCAKSLIALQMQGVARAYWFSFCPVFEQDGRKEWGVMRRDGTVKPLYAVLATQSRELGAARLEGELDVGDGAKAFVFGQPDGSQTVAFWSVSPVDHTSEVRSATPELAREVRLKTGGGEFRLADLCGHASAVTSDQDGILVLPATRFPAYVSGLRGLVADTPPHPAGRVLPYEPVADEDLTVVLRAELNEEDFSLTLNKTRAELRADSGRLRLFVWNFGDTAKTGNVQVAGGRLAGLPDEPFVIGPFGSGPVVFDCTYMPDDGSFDQDLVLSGLFNGKRGSRLTIPMWMEKRFMETCERIPLDWSNLAAWERNDSAQKYRCSWDQAEQAVRFDFEWTDGNNKWLYPYYRLSPGESLEGGKRLAFEVKSAQDKVENDFSNSLVYVGGTTMSYAAPTADWETRQIELPAGCDAGTRDFRLGANPRGRVVTFWVRNVAVLRGK